jgi:hypothetical protein
MDGAPGHATRILIADRSSDLMWPLTSQNMGLFEDLERSARPPSLTLPHKGGGNYGALQFG